MWVKSIILLLLFDSVLCLVTKTRSQGHVTVNINVVTKDLWKQGFRNGANEPTITNSSKQSRTGLQLRASPI